MEHHGLIHGRIQRTQVGRPLSGLQLEVGMQVLGVWSIENRGQLSDVSDWNSRKRDLE